ncbi:MAG: zf-HC2 domain-containing protein [Lachnospiraceae bacterium]|nr:zf-HC2 domain-containing protein [Lachnospiraceae bacterium]
MIQFVCKKQKKKLTCKEAAKMVVPYIEGRLGNKELRRFVNHIEECKDCREELETYYIVYKGLMQLDEKEELPMNIIEALNEDFAVSKQHLKNMSLFYVLSEVTKWLVNISCSLFLIEKIMELILGV